MIPSKTVLIFILFLVVFIGTPWALNGQESQQYEGPFHVGEFKGKASYAYKIENNDTIFNGSFRMQLSDLGALLKKQDTTFFFKGNFEDNYPEGNWQFQFGRFQSDSLTELVGLQYNLKVNGVQEEALGVLKKGKPEGQWNYTLNRIIDSEVAETLFRSSITFEDGIPQKSFKIEESKSTLVGRFLRDGLAHDEWVRYAENNPEISESWFFNDGRLEKVTLTSDTETKEFLIFEAPITNPKTISLDERYLSILSLKNEQLEGFETFKHGIRQLLATNYNYYSKIDHILDELGESAFLPEFKVKVNHFPLDSLETNQLNAVLKLYESAQTTSQSFLTDTQLNILKVSDSEAAYLYGALKAISEEFLYPLEQFINYHQQGVLAYVNRNSVISQLWPTGFPSKNVVFTTQNSPGKTESFRAPNAENYVFSGNNIASVQQIAAYALASVESIQTQLQGKLINTKREQELVQVEEAMIAQINRLNVLLDSVGKSRPKKHINALKNIQAVANENLASYSNTADPDAKLALGQELIKCFHDLQTLENSIFDLARRNEEIEERYKDQIWNPFMANIMTEAVKKRITASYRKVLLPYLLENVSEKLNCSNAVNLAALFKNTHERMLLLRDEDTRKLERKLKKVQDPIETMRLLNIFIGTPEE